MYKIFSVDDHIVEPADVRNSGVPTKFKDAAPHMIEEGGHQFWVHEDRILEGSLFTRCGRPVGPDGVCEAAHKA